MARPKIKIDFDIVQKLCKIQCTAEEIANFIGCSVDTLDRRLREQYKIGFAEYFKKNSVDGKISIRRSQFKLAQKNATMAIWLGKQYLGQKDIKEENIQDGQQKQLELIAEGQAQLDTGGK